MRRLLAASVLMGLVAIVAVGCGVGAAPATTVTFPPETFGPATSVSGAAAETRGDVVRALEAAGYEVTDPKVPFRPAESVSLAGAPRTVIQVVIPNDPNHGFVSIYDFPDPATAAAAAREQAAYLGTGPGRVQFPTDTRFVLRQEASTVIFYSWSPSNAIGDVAGIQTAIETVGNEVAIPR